MQGRKSVAGKAPTRKKIERSPSMSMASSKFSLDDGRAGRLSHDQYMDSATSRMAKLQKAVGSKKALKSDAEVFDDAADAPAMSMMDLMASLDGIEMEGSGQTEQGVFSAHILHFSSNIGVTLSDGAEEKQHGAVITLKCENDHFIVEDQTGTYKTDTK